MMRNVLTAALVACASTAFAAPAVEGAPVATPPPAAAVNPVPPPKPPAPETLSAPLTPEQKKARDERRRAQRAADQAKRKALIEARERAQAEKQGISVEEFRARRLARREASMAKRFGVSVEEFRKMTPEQRRAKRTEMMKRRPAPAAPAVNETKENNAK